VLAARVGPGRAKGIWQARQRWGNKEGWVSGSVGIGYCGHRLGRHASGPKKKQERGGGQYSQLSDGYPSTHRRQDKLQKEGERVVRAIADRSQHNAGDERLGENSGMEGTMSQIFLLESRSPMQLGPDGRRGGSARKSFEGPKPWPLNNRTGSELRTGPNKRLRRRRDWGEDLTDGLRVGNVG
jgi:hypothetical protein